MKPAQDAKFLEMVGLSYAVVSCASQKKGKLAQCVVWTQHSGHCPTSLSTTSPQNTSFSSPDFVFALEHPIITS
jgi:hypothetical protein